MSSSMITSFAHYSENRVPKVVSGLVKLVFTYFLSAFILVSCGTPQNSLSSDEMTGDTVFSGDLNSRAAVKFYLKKKFGIDFKDITPDFLVGDIESRDFRGEEDPYSIVFSFSVKDGELDKQHYVDYVSKVFAVTSKVSDDGNNILGFESKKDSVTSLSKLTFEQLAESGKGTSFLGVEIYTGIYGWSFRRNGVYYRCQMERIDSKGNNGIPYKARTQIYRGLQYESPSVKRNK